MPNTMTRKSEQKALDVVNVIAGICLALSPWVLGFTGTAAAAWNAWIVGVVIALIAIGALVAFAEVEEWANLILGIWSVISPWVLGFTAVTAAMTAHIIIGLIVAVLAAIELWSVHNRSMTAA